MDYSELETVDGVVDVVDVALTKGLSAAKMTTLQRLSSHPKALGIGMASGGREGSNSKRRGSSSSLPATSISDHPDYPSQSPTMAKMTRRHSSSSVSLRQLMRRGSTDTTGSSPLYVDCNDRPMSRRRRSSNGSLLSLGEESDLPSFIDEVVAVDSCAVGKGVANNVVGQRRPSQKETGTLSRGGSSRWNEEKHNYRSSNNHTPAVRRSSSSASLRQLMRRGSIDTNDGASSPPTVNANHPSRQVRRRSSASSLWIMPEDNLGLDEEESGNLTDVAFSRGLSAAKMETLQRVSTEHKTMRLL